jgi:hypothetical protein
MARVKFITSWIRNESQLFALCIELDSAFFDAAIGRGSLALSSQRGGQPLSC